MRIWWALIVIAFLHSTVAAQRDDQWVIRAKIDPTIGNAEPFYGATVANGHLGVVAANTPMRAKCVIEAGVYDIFGRGDVSNFLEGFDMLNLSVEIDGQKLTQDVIYDHHQTLMMRQGELHGEFTWGEKARIEYIFSALRHRPHSAMLVVTIKPLHNISIEGTTTLLTPPGCSATRHKYQNVGGVGLLSAVTNSPTLRHQLSATSSFIFDRRDGAAAPHLAIASDSSYLFSSDLRKGKPFTFAVVGSSISTADHPDPLNQSQRLNLFAALEGIENLQTNHRKEWDELWQSDIIIEGDNQAQLDVRQMIYYLYSFVREGSAMSISPMGLSGTGYNGHIFWDADTWVLPALLVLHPQLGRSLVDYRADRLDDAMKNAASNGYKGAQFPWESADRGVEQTPVFALTGPFEHHITACVALGAWDYFRASRDTTWLKEKGYGLIAQCANFWLSRVTRNGEGMFEIVNVVGADEYAENIDNDAFTNGAAICNLMAATDAAEIVGQKADTMWLHVAQRLVIHRFDNGVTREHKTYNDQIIKQADVNLLSYPLALITDKDQIIRDLDFYETKIADETPAMTHSIFAILSATVGDTERAYSYFTESYCPNKLPPFGVLAETRGGTNPYFATGAGGALQAVMMGFGGLRITRHGIVETGQKLPKHWKSLKIIRYNKSSK